MGTRVRIEIESDGDFTGIDLDPGGGKIEKKEVPANEIFELNVNAYEVDPNGSSILIYDPVGNTEGPLLDVRLYNTRIAYSFNGATSEILLIPRVQTAPPGTPEKPPSSRTVLEVQTDGPDTNGFGNLVISNPMYYIIEQVTADDSAGTSHTFNHNVIQPPPSASPVTGTPIPSYNVANDSVPGGLRRILNVSFFDANGLPDGGAYLVWHKIDPAGLPGGTGPVNLFIPQL